MSDVNRYTATRLKFEGGEIVCSADAPIEVVPAFDYDALAQQLAASEAKCMRLTNGVEEDYAEVARIQGEYDKQWRKSRERRIQLADRDKQLTEAQATVTRLEALVAKGIGLDYQRRQEIAEAVGLLRGLKSIGWHTPEVNAYLAKHSEKENDC